MWPAPRPPTLFEESKEVGTGRRGDTSSNEHPRLRSLHTTGHPSALDTAGKYPNQVCKFLDVRARNLGNTHRTHAVSRGALR